jgi:hypothetical protein
MHRGKDIRKVEEPYITKHDLTENKTFIDNYQKALLFSLLERNLITRVQYERCMQDLGRVYKD